MRFFESLRLLDVNLGLALIGILVVAGMAYSDEKPAEPVRKGTQLQRPTDAEDNAYEQWYRVFRDRDLGSVIDLGELYVHSYPDGRYVGFIKLMIGFARVSLDSNQAKRTETLRAQVTASFADSAEELGALVRQVLNKQSDVNTRVGQGTTALMFAAANADRETMKALIDLHADIDAAESTHRWTALIYAIWRGDRLSIRYLLESYADADIGDKEGRTALDHAKATGDFEIMLLISGRPRRGQSK